MKKYIIANNIFIAIQMVLLALSVVLNFVADDARVYMAVFIHIGIFVLYNAVVESIVEYKFLRKKYAKICDETHHLRYFKLKKRIYTSAKNHNDYVSVKLILQSFTKSIIAITNIVLMLFMVTFE